MHVRVDESGDQVAAAGVDPLAALVGADAGDPAVGQRHVAVEPLAREDAEHARALDHQVRLHVPSRDGDQSSAGAAPHSPTMSSGRTGTRVSGAPVAERRAATIAGVEEIVGGSPTPRSP